jgi:hypothetical protein
MVSGKKSWKEGVLEFDDPSYEIHITRLTILSYCKIRRGRQ